MTRFKKYQVQLNCSEEKFINNVLYGKTVLHTCFSEGKATVVGKTYSGDIMISSVDNKLAAEFSDYEAQYIEVVGE